MDSGDSASRGSSGSHDWNRRDADITQIKKSLAALEKQTDDMEETVWAMNSALFGVPQDRLNNGMVGQLADVREALRAANNKLIGTLVAMILAGGIEIVRLAVGH